MKIGEQRGTHGYPHQALAIHIAPTNFCYWTACGNLHRLTSGDKMISLRALAITVVCLALALDHACAGPLVARFETIAGNFEVLMDPSAAPISVANFSVYANRGSYDSTIVHRSTTYDTSSIQIIQGGGYQLAGNTITPVTPDPPIALEAVLTNQRGTIAMARTAELNSATSQWYFNVTDNPALDFNYAVFGRVLGKGQSVIDTLGKVPVYNASLQLGFSELPLLQASLVPSSLVVISKVRVEPLAVTNLIRTPSGVELRWSILSTNTPLRVERTTNIDGGPWTTIASNVTTGLFTDTNTPVTGAFYRLVTGP